MLNEAVVNFLKNQEEVTMIASPNKFVMKNYISSNPKENQTAVHTELTMHPNEFQSFEVSSDCSITYCLKELRAMIALADAFDLPLNASYCRANEPIYFQGSTLHTFLISICPFILFTRPCGNPRKHFNVLTLNNS